MRRNEKAYDKTPEGEQESETDSVFECKEPCLNLQLAVAVLPLQPALPETNFQAESVIE